MSEKTAPQQRFEIQRLYIKDLSLESPMTPHVFREQLQPETNIDLNVTSTPLEESHYEVVLRATITMKKEEKSIFILEVKYAGIFHIAGFQAEQMEHMLRAYCPNILFPYVREVVSHMTTQATFPPVHLSPINFDAIFLQQKEQEANKGK